ncbi:thaumatin-like protein [Mycena crocata]|nr:thaumatin-like protein [Mycena crocata]
MKGFTALASLAAVSMVSARTFTVKNSCPYTVWYALRFFDTAGPIWGRTECDFSSNPGPTSCATGGCNGGLLCDPNTGTGVPPATVAEFISLFTNNKGCGVPSCSADLTPKCPSQLAYKDSTGAVVADLDGMPGDSANCCSGSHNTLPTCPTEGVAFYDYFKSACPDSYVYALDEPSGTALWHCDSNLHADFTIDFCALNL